MNKVPIDLQKGKVILYPGATALVTCTYEGKSNIITITFISPVSDRPPTVIISVSPKRYSYDMLINSKEYVINIPGPEILKETHFCGRHSGKDMDKFKETGLSASPAQMVKAPIIKECFAHIECKLVDIHPVGSHKLFIGEIVAASINEGLFDSTLILGEEKVKTLHFLGGNKYGLLKKEVIA